MIYFSSIIYVTILIAGFWLPWVQLRSQGISMSGKDYFSPFIKKNIFGYKHNKKIFASLVTIQRNKLNISFQELEEMYLANVDFQTFIDALLLVRSKNINVSEEVLKTLAYSSKDMMAIINAAKPGEEIRLEDVFGNKKVVWQK